ncbi:MAG TPA: FeoA family protein [Vicinamibacteria bacterium]|nr:FeoA family protein [Vicinamibacteria bacterium]
MAAITCPMCGFEFVPGGPACRVSGCPMAVGGCHTHHCPRCGHAMPDEDWSVLARWVRRLFGRGAPAAATLAGLSPGESAVVDKLTGDGALLAGLTAQGLVPGARLTLVQRAPAYVIEIGETTLALEHAVAEGIWLLPGDDAGPREPVEASR